MADQRAQYTEEAVGANHPTKTDVANRLCLVEHNNDGTHINFSVPSGETVLFYKNTAVTGYALQDTLDDKIVYITKGSVAGGQTGGGVHSTGSWTISGLTVDAHTHTVPSHTHAQVAHSHVLEHGEPLGSKAAGEPVGHIGTGAALATIVAGGYTGYQSVSYTQVDGATNTGAGGTGNTGAASSSSIASAGTWRPAAYCFTMQTRT